jgi:hypothetical protein
MRRRKVKESTINEICGILDYIKSTAYDAEMNFNCVIALDALKTAFKSKELTLPDGAIEMKPPRGRRAAWVMA